MTEALTNLTAEVANEGTNLPISPNDILTIVLGVFLFFAMIYVINRYIIQGGRNIRDYGSLEGLRRRINKPKKLYSQTFNKNKFKDFCGVEVECIQNRNYKLSREGAEELHFKKVRDGSLSTYGVEFVSEPANGDKLFNIIDKLCGELNRMEYSIDKTCGLHVHIETPEELDLVKKLYIFYSKYENFFFKMLPSSRQRSRFCEKIRKTDNFSIKDVEKMTSLHQFKRKYYKTNFYGSDINDRYFKKRYCWTNFHSLFYRGTLEIRAHSGTINSEKIKNWIIIHLTIMNFVKSKSVEEIYALSVKKETFMNIFPTEIRKYLKSRWGKFKKTEEEYNVSNTNN